MSNLEVVLNQEGVRELLRSSEMQDICQELAEDMAGRVKGNYELSTMRGKNRVNVSISAGDESTYWDNIRHNTLAKAMRK